MTNTPSHAPEVGDRLKPAPVRRHAGHRILWCSRKATEDWQPGFAPTWSLCRPGSGSFQEYVWVGWPGNTIDPSRQEELTATARESFHAVPVFLAHEEMEQFYHGFCNSTIWPLFHYFTAYSMFDERTVGTVHPCQRDIL